MKARILWIEGKRAESPSFVPALRKKDYLVEVVSTGSAALARLLEVDPDLVVINAPSLRTSGRRICRDLHEKMSTLPIVVILSPEQVFTGETCASVVLRLPFTVRKLFNRITPLLPGDGQQMLHVGHIRLDLERRRVRCQGREARLTPRLTHLLQVLMEHAGEVIERQQLFKEVWDTDYTADTRTLDVHISWLREALEEDPRHPQYLKTIRAVGYRLDV
ncbi:MAG TPA: response regulator transcription factor [Anaerolineales bacterium]|nr:response regulator transcription factor [Anaerolineales bacterium]